MQIGPRHKVACHFAGQLGSAPTTPVTLSALGVNARGDDVTAASPEPGLNVSGFSDTFIPLATRAADSLPLADK